MQHALSCLVRVQFLENAPEYALAEIEALWLGSTVTIHRALACVFAITSGAI